MAAVGAHRDSLPLIWFDAHGDFNTPETTETGSLGGMVLAILCKETLPELSPTIIPSRVWHVGGSEFDTGEQDRMCCAGVRVVPYLQELPTTKFHLHIDTDVIRSSDLPSSIHPAHNGIPADSFFKQMQLLMPHADVVSIKSHDPTIDDGRGAAILTKLLETYYAAKAT